MDALTPTVLNIKGAKMSSWRQWFLWPSLAAEEQNKITKENIACCDQSSDLFHTFFPPVTVNVNPDSVIVHYLPRSSDPKLYFGDLC